MRLWGPQCFSCPGSLESKIKQTTQKKNNKKNPVLNKEKERIKLCGLLIRLFIRLLIITRILSN